MTESEKKQLLTKEAYDCLMDAWGYNGPFTRKPVTRQINYYFDTDDLSMDRRNITCRIRLKDGVYTATMKRHIPHTDHATETDMEIGAGLAHNAFTEMGLVLQGALITERCVLRKDAGCEVVLDENKYLGYTDYELEIEYAEGHEKAATELMDDIRDLLAENGLSLSDGEERGVPGKSKRFFQRKEAACALHP